VGWATRYIEKLRAGETVMFRPTGNSMQGKINSGQLVTVSPVGAAGIHAGDVVLCKVHGREFLHLVKVARLEDGRVSYQIGNMKGGINGWIGPGSVFGVLVKVED
jgi:hypothetical protein